MSDPVPAPPSFQIPLEELTPYAKHDCSMCSGKGSIDVVLKHKDPGAEEETDERRPNPCPAPGCALAAWEARNWERVQAWANERGLKYAPPNRAKRRRLLRRLQ